MKKKFRELFENYKDLIPYAVFGVLSTTLNIGTYWIFSHLLHIPVIAATILAWIITVLFVYITNRRWVFHSEADTKKAVIKELTSFYVCRVGTELVDLACMFIFVDMLHINDILIKVGANILVIVLNYIASKFLIFKHK